MTEKIVNSNLLGGLRSNFSHCFYSWLLFQRTCFSVLGSKLTFYECHYLMWRDFFQCVFVCTGKEDTSFVALFLYSSYIISIEPLSLHKEGNQVQLLSTDILPLIFFHSYLETVSSLL